MEIRTLIDNNIVLAMASLQTISTVKISTIDEVASVHTAVILRIIAAVKVIDRGGLIKLIKISGEKIVMGKIHGGMNKIAVKWRIVLLVMVSLTAITMNSSITPSDRG